MPPVTDLDRGLAHYAYDMGNIGFANALVCMGSFAVFGGWAVLTTRVFPAMGGLADGGQWRRVGTDPVCLADNRLAAALQPLLDLGHRSVHPTAQESNMMVLAFDVTAGSRARAAVTLRDRCSRHVRGTSRAGVRCGRSDSPAARREFGASPRNAWVRANHRST
jgi:hypothetical protein